VLLPCQQRKLAGGTEDKEHAMSQKLSTSIAVIGIDIGKYSFRIVGQDRRGAVVLRQKWSRGQVEARLANLPPCLIGMEACVGAHHLSRKLKVLGHDARLMPAKYVRPYSKGQKNDFRDAEAIAEAVQRPTMKFVATKTSDQLDLQALHRVRERFVGQRTGIINQIRAFLLERGIAVRKGLRFLRAELPGILATRTDALSPRMLRIIEDLSADWRRLDERIEGLSGEIELLSRQDKGCERLMTVPGIGPIISGAMVAAIGTGDAFSKGRDFGAWLGLVPKQISTGDRTILGSISRQGNRYLRSLFVQAAWVVCWSRSGQSSGSAMGSSRGSRAQGNACTRTCWRLRLPTSLPASPGRFSTTGAPLSASRPMRQRPNPLSRGAVLGPVKAWPNNAGASGKASATASLDRPCARRTLAPAGRDEGTGRQARTKEQRKAREAIDDVKQHTYPPSPARG
jgi:transposase